MCSNITKELLKEKSQRNFKKQVAILFSELQNHVDIPTEEENILGLINEMGGCFDIVQNEELLFDFDICSNSVTNNTVSDEMGTYSFCWEESQNIIDVDDRCALSPTDAFFKVWKHIVK